MVSAMVPMVLPRSLPILLLTYIPAVISSAITSLPTTTGVNENAPDGWTAAADTAWTDYLTAFQARYAEGIQPHCVPSKHDSTSGGNVGVIVLFHGFSACPGQFYDWVPMLQAQGYTVLLPLIPGHGLNYVWQPTYRNCGPWYFPWSRQCLSGYTARDSYDHLMTDESEALTFIDEINAIVRLAGGTRVIGGLSFGGALATLAGATTYTTSGGATASLYSRQYLSVPFFDLPTFVMSSAISAAAFFSLSGNAQMGWGAACEVERSYGRAGICQFRIRHLNTITKIGQQSASPQMNQPMALAHNSTSARPDYSS